MKLSLYGIPAPLLTRWIVQLLFPNGVASWVDLGFGTGEYIQNIGVIPAHGVGVDAVDRMLVTPPNFKLEKREINDWLSGNGDKQFGLATLFDVVEHLPKEEAFHTIRNAERIAGAVIISTPSGFMVQNAETHPEEKDNPGQWHRSGFAPEEFEKLGFAVVVLRNYHYKPIGNDRTFDKIVAFRSSATSPEEIFFKVGWRALLYNLNPLHLYRTVRDYLLRPLF